MSYIIDISLRLLCIFSPLLLIILLLSNNINAEFTPTFVISGYGFIVLIYFIIMLTLGRLNKRQIDNIMNYNISSSYRDYKKKSISCVVCGYKENTSYFLECLNSIKKINYDKVFVIIDGNDNDDQYMVNLFKKVFNDNYTIIELEKTLDDEYKKILINDKYICITQPHKGKRHAMYTGFILSEDNKMDLVMTVDSDTIIEKTALEYVKKSFNDLRIGGVTGYLNIYNNNTIISYLSKLRYWFAFNLERAFGSYYGGVLCLSGPISCYRTLVLTKCINKWINQHFLGQKCTYGDDRHLTNHVLLLGYKTIYNPYIKGHTETPEELTRFVKQQLRWTKSCYRELFWVFKFLHKHNILMSLDISYQVVYPFIIFLLLLYIILKINIFSFIVYLYGIFIISFIRSLYAFLNSHKFDILLFYNYSLLYILLIIPIKIFAIFTLNDTNWGSIGRHSSDGLSEWLFIFIWNIILIIGTLLTLTNNIYNNSQIILLSVLMSIYILGYLFLYFLSIFNITIIYKKILYKSTHTNILNNNEYLIIEKI
jgi:hyaluronan synthase